MQFPAKFMVSRRFLFSLYAMIGSACLILMPHRVAAQVQRSTINLSFEQPQIGDPVGTGVCQGYVYANRVPGWQTSDAPLSSPTPDYDDPPGCNNNPEPTPSPVRVFEYYTTNVVDNVSGLAMAAADGRNFVELNSHTSARLYQNVCLIPGERIDFSFSHLGRRSPTIADVARMQIGGTAALGSGQTVITVADSNDGTGAENRIVGTGLSTDAVRTQGPLAGPAGSNRFWGNYRGSFLVPAGLSGLQQIAFEAVSASNNSTDQGNFLDNIAITMRPAIEFSSPTYTYSVIEGAATAPSIQFRVAGVVAAGGVPVAVTVTPGSATLGTDYTINGGSAATFTFIVPAGDYGAGTLLSTGIPVSVINDVLLESAENFTVSIAENPNLYTVMSTTICGANGVASAVYTIQDNDGTITVTKDAQPNDAQDFAFTTTGTGLAAFSLDDDADATLPATRSFIVNAGSYTVTESAVTAWDLIALACTDPDSGSSTNLASRVATIDLDPGETVACTFTNRARANLAIFKTNTYSAAAPSDQASDTVTRGTETEYVITVSNTGPVPITGAVVRDVAQAGITCPAGNAITFSAIGNPGTAQTVGNLTSTSGVTLGTIPAGQSATLTFRCTVT